MRPVNKPKGSAHKLPRRKRNPASQPQASARARTVDIGLPRSQLRAIRRREDRLLRLEHLVARSFAEADSESTALRAVMRAVCEIEGWECGRYFRVDEKAGVLRFADAWGVKDPRVERFIEASRPLTYRPGVGLSGKAWQSGKPLWSTDVTKDSRTSSGSSTGLSHEMGTHATFVFPVFSDGKPIGVLSFASRKAREPAKRLLEAIHAIGSQIGQFVQRKQAEAVLRGSEARFRSLTSLSSDWYWEQDENFRFVEITGRNISSAGTGLPHRYLGKPRWETGLDLVEGTWDEHRALLQSHQPFHDVMFVRKHPAGGVHYTAVSGEPIFDAEGRFKGYRGLGRDVTGRKREETLLAM